MDGRVPAGGQAPPPRMGQQGLQYTWLPEEGAAHLALRTQGQPKVEKVRGAEKSTAGVAEIRQRFIMRKQSKGRGAQTRLHQNIERLKKKPTEERQYLQI